MHGHRIAVGVLEEVRLSLHLPLVPSQNASGPALDQACRWGGFIILSLLDRPVAFSHSGVYSVVFTSSI